MQVTYPLEVVHPWWVLHHLIKSIFIYAIPACTYPDSVIGDAHVRTMVTSFNVNFKEINDVTKTVIINDAILFALLIFKESAKLYWHKFVIKSRYMYTVLTKFIFQNNNICKHWLRIIFFIYLLFLLYYSHNLETYFRWGFS